jgi:chromosome segregation ATPase
MDLIKALQDIRHGMAELKQDIAALKYDMAEMKAFRQEATVHLGRFESGLETLRKDMNQFRNRMSDVERDIDSLKSR